MNGPPVRRHSASGAVPRRTQQERRAETERRVLDATLRLIASAGSRSVSLAQVGEEAGYSRGIVTHQFGTRAELLRRATIYSQHAVPAPDPRLAGLDRLLGLVENYLDFLVKQGAAGHAFLLMWAEAVASEPSIRPIYVERDQWFRQLISDLVADGITDGSIRSDAASDAVAVILVGQLRGIGLQLMLTSNPAPYDLIRTEALRLVRDGLQTPSPVGSPPTGRGPSLSSAGDRNHRTTQAVDSGV